MKNFKLLVLFLLPLLGLAQSPVYLAPYQIIPLDFGPQAQKEWALRDSLLEALSAGDLKWDDLSQEALALLEKYGEVYENIWDIEGQGCSWYCGGGPKSVTASSYLASQGAISYKPENAHDLNYKNAWAEGASDYGIGEYLLYTFAAESPRVTEIIVVNGYVKSDKAWRENSRVKTLKLYYNQRPIAILNLEDKVASQYFKLGIPIGYSERENFELLRTKEDWSLKFEILEVYKGSKYKDTVISEIYFDGIDVH